MRNCVRIRFCDNICWFSRTPFGSVLLMSLTLIAVYIKDDLDIVNHKASCTFSCLSTPVIGADKTLLVVDEWMNKPINE